MSPWPFPSPPFVPRSGWTFSRILDLRVRNPFFFSFFFPFVSTWPLFFLSYSSSSVFFFYNWMMKRTGHWIPDEMQIGLENRCSDSFFFFFFFFLFPYFSSFYFSTSPLCFFSLLPLSQDPKWTPSSSGENWQRKEGAPRSAGRQQQSGCCPYMRWATPLFPELNVVERGWVVLIVVNVLRRRRRKPTNSIFPIHFSSSGKSNWN